MLLLLATVILVIAILPRATRSKQPAWTPSDHPRLIVTAAERGALVAKLTTPGTISNAVWNSFLTTNRANSAGINYADGAIIYWIAGNATAGRQAIDRAKRFMTDFPDGLTPNISGVDLNWWRYRDYLLIYDFAYDLLTPTEQQQFKEFMVLQGAKCEAGAPAWFAGNIHTKWTFCLYGSAVLLEGENITITVSDEAVVRGSTANGADLLRYPSDAANIGINDSPGQSGSQYHLNTDFLYRYVPGCGRCLDWSPSGSGTNEPSPGTTYYVSYTVTPNLQRWKSVGRQAFENYLSYQWRDGYYSAGLNPYGTITAEMIPYFVEMFKRDLGVDYSQNRDLKRMIDLYLYERLPSVPSGVTRRFNTLNDTAGWTDFYGDAWLYPRQLGYRVWLRPFVAWATAAYQHDPEGYGDRYRWFWTQAYRNVNGTVKFTDDPDWREAWWINNQAFGEYPVTTIPNPTWSKHRYFRGKEVVYSRTDNWGVTDRNATLLSFVAGPHNYQNEHDQGDAGSFTFFSQNEDWAIDPGYGYDTTGEGYNLYDHNSVGIDGGGFNVSGVYGVPYATPQFGGFAHFDDVVLTDQASALKAELTDAWTLTTTPYLKNDERYALLLNGSQPSYLIVADDIQKDSGPHSYEWYLHTGPGNTIAVNGSVTTIGGVRGGVNSPNMEVHTLNPAAPSITQSTANVGTVGVHPRLQVKATNTINPYFLHLLIPSQPSQKPSVTTSTVANGTVARVTWLNGTIDTILWRHGAGTISGNGVTTDGKLTMVRELNNQVTGFAVIDGRSITRQSQPLLNVLDGTQTVTVTAFGANLGIQGTDVARVIIALPTITAATLEDGLVTLPISNDGSSVFLNAGLPLAEMRRGAGIRYDETFDSGYADNLFRFNLSVQPAEQFLATSGALELLPTSYDWPSITTRDSTTWRRADIFPTVIPPLEHGDAIVSFKYKFTDSTSATKKFRVYLRTEDRNPVDWSTNQDYVRLELNATNGNVVKNEITLGQRVNGSWASIDDNDVLTATLPSTNAVINDTDWHTASVRLLGDAARVTIDGSTVIDATLPTTIPTAPAAGYIQWKVVGSSPVRIDDIAVASIDQTRPVSPTAGGLAIGLNGNGNLNLFYNQGTSTDAQTVTLYESANPINADTDPTTLAVIVASSATSPSFAFTNADRTKYHAVSVKDPSGNESPLLPLTVDTEPPAAITDLRAQ